MVDDPLPGATTVDTVFSITSRGRVVREGKTVGNDLSQSRSPTAYNAGRAGSLDRWNATSTGQQRQQKREEGKERATGRRPVKA